MSPTGIAELEHDNEVMLMNLALILNRSPAQRNIGWIVNRKPWPSEHLPARSMIDFDLLLSGFLPQAETHRCKDYEQEELEFKASATYKEHVFFDACEVVSAGQVAWRISHDPSINLTGFKYKKGDLFTPAELLMRVADVLMPDRTRGIPF